MARPREGAVSDVRASRVARTTVRSRLARISRAPAVWVAGLVALSTALRGVICATVPNPWILPDEIVYSELAKSIAEGHRPSVRGVSVFGWGEVYPTMIAPAWALIHDPVQSYHAALLISALAMSLSAVPAYALARLFVSSRSAFVVALMTLLVPSMAYTGVVMTENAFYPVFLLAVLLVTRAVRDPTVGRQGLALLGLILVAFTRIQGLALVGAYLCAVAIYWLTSLPASRRGYLRRFLPSAILLLFAPAAPVVASIAAGEGPFGWLGSRSGTFEEFHAREVPEWLVYLMSDLVLYVAVIPLAATAVVIGRGLSRRAPERVRLFAAVALPTLVATLGSVSLVSASVDVDGNENLNERYVFYVVPLMFVGLALWIREGLPRGRPWSFLVVAGSCLLVVVLPIERFEYNALFQSVALLPWLHLSLPRVMLAAVAGLFVLLCGVVWLTCRADRIGRFWLLTAIWLAFLGALTLGTNFHSGRYFGLAFDGMARTWVDNAVPGHAKVPVLWDQTRAESGRPDPFDYWIMVTEFFNTDIGTVYRLGPTTYYETFLPSVPVKQRRDGMILDRSHRALTTGYVLVTCRTPVEGDVVAESPRGALQLVRVDGNLRLKRHGGCTRRIP